MGKSVFQEELDAIRALRDAFPQEGPKKLANRIKDGDFEIGEHKTHARTAIARSILSVYSAIRRHDASKKQAGKVKVKVKGKKLATV